MKTLLAAVVASVALVAGAFTYPVSVGVVPGLQVADRFDNVDGLQLGLLWDATYDVNGLSLATFGNITEGKFNGADLAFLFNRIDDDATGWTGSLFYNRARRDFYGLSSSFGFNVCEGDLRGFDAALFFAGTDDFHGFSLSLYNYTRNGAGLQVGLVNCATRDFDGVQIGLVNLILKSCVPALPVVNAHF